MCHLYLQIFLYIFLLYEKLVQKFYKKKIILYFEDNHDYAIKFILNIIKKKYIINISDKNPDYLIYNVFGCNHINQTYKNSIKIAIFTENQIPDFSIADYAISNAHVNYLDRHLKYPFYLIEFLKSVNNYNFKVIRDKLLRSPRRKKFCAALITNSWFTDNMRLDFINELNKYKKIDMGGRYKNNVGNINNIIKLNFCFLINFLLLWKILKEMAIYLKKLLIPF